MNGVLWGVLAASLVGSLHCAGMCGPLVVFCGGGERPRPAALLAYHLARLVGYLALGLAAGTLGAAVDLGGRAAGFGRAAAVVAGVFMIVAGVGALFGPRWKKGPGPGARVLTRLMGRASKLGAMQRSLVIGGLTAFLPCGWLYAFLAAAASTGAALSGALVMAAFWLGSVPVLLGLGVGAGTLLGPLRRRAPAVVAVLLIGLGLFTVAGRFEVPSFAETLGGDVGARALAGELAGEELPCCSGASTPEDSGLAPSLEPCGCTHPGKCVAGETCGCPGCGKQ